MRAFQEVQENEEGAKIWEILRYRSLRVTIGLCRWEFQFIPYQVRPLHSLWLSSARREAVQFASCRRMAKAVFRSLQQGQPSTPTINNAKCGLPESTFPSHLQVSLVAQS